MLRFLSLTTGLSVLIWFAAIRGDRVDAQDVPVAANQNMVTQFKGTLKGFQRGVVLVTRDDGSEVLVELPNNISSFQFVASAKPAFLQRGAMVRFYGTFNQAGFSLSPITKVELFQPISGKLIGGSRENFLPGVYPETDHNPQQPLPAVAKCKIVGGLMGLDAQGGMLVQAGKQPVRVQLAEDAAIEIRYNNLSLAQEGDAVSVAGFYQPPDDTKVKADRITITTDRVYGEVDTTTPNRASRRRTRRTEEAKDSTPTEEKPSDAAEANAAEAKNGVQAENGG